MFPDVRNSPMPNWRKSRRSQVGDSCVEVGNLGGGLVGVRDTKDGGCGPVLAVTPAAWRSLVDRVRAGRA